jgi:hypothetical protein
MAAEIYNQLQYVTPDIFLTFKKADIFLIITNRQQKQRSSSTALPLPG